MRITFKGKSTSITSIKIRFISRVLTRVHTSIPYRAFNIYIFFASSTYENKSEEFAHMLKSPTIDENRGTNNNSYY